MCNRGFAVFGSFYGAVHATFYRFWFWEDSMTFLFFVFFFIVFSSIYFLKYMSTFLLHIEQLMHVEKFQIHDEHLFEISNTY